MKKKHCTAVYTQNELELSWTRGTKGKRQGGEASNQRGTRQNRHQRQQQQQPRNDNDNDDGGGITKLERQNDKRTDRQNTDGNFLCTNSAKDRKTDSQPTRLTEKTNGQQKIQLNIEITNPQLSCVIAKTRRRRSERMSELKGAEPN